MNPSIILVSPKGAGNVGGVARLMGNFGFEDLRIVSPRCELDSLECKRMAMASFDLIQKAKIYPTLEEAQADRTFSLAFSGRRMGDTRPRLDLFEFTENFSKVIHEQDRVAFVFGREEWGLRLEELDQCDRVIEIPTTEEKPSINLTSAVAITLGVLFKSSRNSFRPQREIIRPTKQDEEVFFRRVHRVLEQTKFLNPQNPAQNLDDLRSIYHRSDATDRELRILFGILTEIETMAKFCPEISSSKTARKKSS